MYLSGMQAQGHLPVYTLHVCFVFVFCICVCLS